MSTLNVHGAPLYLQVEGNEDEETEVGQAPDPAAAERKRLREAEEWRLQQLRSGITSSNNSNFQVRSLLDRSSH